MWWRRARCGCWPTVGWLRRCVIGVEPGDLGSRSVNRRLLPSPPEVANRGAVPQPAACAEAPSRWLHDRSEGPDPQRPSWRALGELPPRRRRRRWPSRSRSCGPSRPRPRPSASRRRRRRGRRGSRARCRCGRSRRASGRAGRSPTSPRPPAWTPAWVERFATPVFAERAQVIARCRARRCGGRGSGPSEHPIDEAIRRNLADRNVSVSPEEFADGWTARQLADGRWAVRFRYRHRSRDHVLRFDLDDASGTVVAADRPSEALAFIAPTTPCETPSHEPPPDPGNGLDRERPPREPRTRPLRAT